MIFLLDEVRHRENMTAEEVKAAFLSSVARMAPRLPFSYFSPQVMAAQLLERLRGVPFNGAKYIAERNVPDPSAGAYHYVPWGREEAGSLKRCRNLLCRNHGAAQPAYAARFYAARPF